MKLISIPSEQGSLEKNLGCKEAPDAIVEELKNENLEIDSVAVAQNDIEETDRRIYEKAKELFEVGERVLFLGGDHSITYALFKAFSQAHKDAALIVFDAHADATTFFKPVSHEDMNKVLVEEGLVKAESLLLAGVRKIWKAEREFLKKNKIKIISAKEIQENLNNSIKNLQSFIHNKTALYVSIDVDCFSPRMAPGTGYREKDGLGEKEFFTLFEIVKGGAKAFDLCEVNPRLDEKRKTVQLAAKIVKKII